jgi:hypothetical protein
MNQLETAVAYAVSLQKQGVPLAVRQLAHDLQILFPGLEVEAVVKAIKAEVARQRTPWF